MRKLVYEIENGVRVSYKEAMELRARGIKVLVKLEKYINEEDKKVLENCRIHRQKVAEKKKLS